MRPDKKKVTDEVWSDTRVREFLAREPWPGDDHPDFVLLLNAYRGMRPDDFARFMRFFLEDGHDPVARNAEGETFAEHVAGHHQAGEFIDIIERARAGAGS